MRLSAALSGDLRRVMADELKAASAAITRSIEEASAGLHAELRAEASAALGPRVGNAWRKKKYPQGRDSMAAAGWIYTKAPNIIRAFSESQIIRAKNGNWLAIPGPGCPPRIGRKKPTPRLVEEHFKQPLRFVYLPGRSRALLVMSSMRASFSRKTGELRGFRTLSEKRRAAGQSGMSVIMFYLVPAVRSQKLLNLDAKIAAWEARLPGLMVRNWDAMTKSDLARMEM